MFCPHCGKSIADTDKFCTSCGAPRVSGVEVPSGSSSSVCVSQPASAPQSIVVVQQASTPQPQYTCAPCSRTSYVLLGIFLGGLGIHNFYAKRTGCAVAQLLLGLSVVGWIIAELWSFIELFAVTTDGYGRKMV